MSKFLTHNNNNNNNNVALNVFFCLFGLLPLNSAHQRSTVSHRNNRLPAGNYSTYSVKILVEVVSYIDYRLQERILTQVINSSLSPIVESITDWPGSCTHIPIYVKRLTVDVFALSKLLGSEHIMPAGSMTLHIKIQHFYTIIQQRNVYI